MTENFKGSYATRTELLKAIKTLHFIPQVGHFIIDSDCPLSEGEYKCPWYYIQRYSDGWGLRVEYFIQPGCAVPCTVRHLDRSRRIKQGIELVYVVYFTLRWKHYL